MGPSSTESLRGIEAVFDRFNNSNPTFISEVQEKQDGQIKRQAPIYFVSEVLNPSKKNYTELEKVLYAVLMASRKLRHYFQAYHIIVPSSQPLKDIIRNREATGRVRKWAA
jgi:hypothetical protein